MDYRFLYRGICLEHHKRDSGVLKPKGDQAERSLFFDGTWTFGDGMLYGASKTNAVILHQKDSNRFPTAYVSFSPHLDRAIYYATHRWDGQKAVPGNPGIIYVVDTALLDAHGVEAYRIADYAKAPTVPGDDEVALLAPGGGALPPGIIVDHRPAP